MRIRARRDPRPPGPHSAPSPLGDHPRPERILTGGQTGAEQAAWRVAQAFGIPTGGWMPRGFLTETADGRGTESPPGLAEIYGARELPTADYPARTRANVRDSDATLWFGDVTTPGAKATLTACRQMGKSVCLVTPGGPTRPSHVAEWIETHRIRVQNVAGNRASKAPDIGPRGERFLAAVLVRLGHKRV